MFRNKDKFSLFYFYVNDRLIEKHNNIRSPSTRKTQRESFLDLNFFLQCGHVSKRFEMIQFAFKQQFSSYFLVLPF